jgi:hypothetical protein
MDLGSGEKHPVADLPKPFVYDTMMGFNSKNAFSLTPAGTMGMPNREVEAGKFDKPGMNMDTHDQWSSQGGLSYILTQYISATALWDSDYGVGAGFTIRF